MNILTANGIDLAYAQHGTGVPVVLIHGFPLEHSIWDETIGPLAETCRLIVPDLRGFGGSSAPDSSYSLEDMAADLAGLLDHLGLEKATLVGHSMGGYIALAFARRYPERVSGLALVASQPLADTPEQKKGRYETAGKVVEGGVSIVRDAMLPKLSADAKIQESLHQIISRQKPAGVVGALKAMAERADSSPVLAAARFPILIVHGDADQLIPIERARQMKELNQAADLIELKGIGHMPMMEAPGAVAKEIAKFVLKSGE